jgi:hypothetical protein
MGILDKFLCEGASGGYEPDLRIAETPLTFYAFILIFTGFTLNHKQGFPFWEDAREGVYPSARDDICGHIPSIVRGINW